jgi:hypothetical protein
MDAGSPPCQRAQTPDPRRVESCRTVCNGVVDVHDIGVRARCEHECMACGPRG